VVLVLPAPPQVGVGWALHRDAVGVDEGAVEVQVGGSGRARGEDRLVYVRGEGGEQVDRLVQWVVAGGLADAVVCGQLPYAGGVEEPAQYQHRVPERPSTLVPRRVPARSQCSWMSLARKYTVSRRASSAQVKVIGSAGILGTRSLSAAVDLSSRHRATRCFAPS
jgi:hypothetical protein